MHHRRIQIRRRRKTRGPQVRVLLLLFLLGGWIGGTAAVRAASAPLSTETYARIQNARSLMEQGKVDEALAVLEAHRRRHPDGHHLVDFLIGNGALAQQRLPAAIAAYERCLAKAPGFAAAWMNLGKALCDAGRWAEGASCFEKALANDVDRRPELMGYAARAYLAGGRPKDAGRLLDRLRSEFPDRVDRPWQEMRARVYLARELPRRALPLIAALAAAGPDQERRPWQEMLLAQYLALDMPEAALAFARERADADPAAPRWWRALVHLHLDRRRYPEALSALIALSRVVSLTDDERKLKADLYMQLNNYRPALAYYQGRVQRSPDGRSLETLVYLLRRLDRPAEALARIDAHADITASGDWMRRRGELLLGLERFDRAAEAFRRSAAAHPAPGRDWLMAGYAALKAKDVAGARAAFVRASGFAGQAAEARRMLGHLATDPGGGAENEGAGGNEGGET